jgi:hypothetical protein
MNDDRLRTALHDLSDIPPPPDLAGSALARARRDRRRITAGITAAAGILVATVLALPAVFGPPGPSISAGAPTGAGTPLPSAYVYAYSKINRSDETVYDPATHSYRQTSSNFPGRSPDGRLWVVVDTGTQLRYGVVGLADLIAGRPPARWLLTSHDGPRWSPDSTRLLYTEYAGTGRTWSVDVRTGVRTEIRFSGLGDLTGRVNWVGWGPGGGFLAEVLPTPRTARNPDGTVLYDPRGTVEIAVTDATGVVRTRAAMPTAGGPASLSPEESRFVTSDGKVLDRATGRMLDIAAVPAGWLDEDHLVVWDRTASRLRVVDVRTGATTSTTALPKDVVVPEIAVVDGDVPPGAIVV